jgi:hypothetical protein
MSRPARWFATRQIELSSTLGLFLSGVGRSADPKTSSRNNFPLFFPGNFRQQFRLSQYGNFGCHNAGRETEAMTKLDERTVANMDVVLERVWGVFSHGGDHETRKFIARKLKMSAQRGATTLGALNAVADKALEELARRGERGAGPRNLRA